LAKLRGNFGESRASALWGKRGAEARGRVVVVLALATVALTLPFAAIADDHSQNAFVEAGLLTTVKRNPDALIRVIVQAADGMSTAGVANEVVERLDDNSRAGDQLTGRFQTVTGVAATLTGDQVLDLAAAGEVKAITRDVPMVPSSDITDGALGANGWLRETGILSALRTTTLMRATPPTIAIVDSGIEAGRAFGGRVVGQISMTQLQPNSAGDGRGHGTFVTGLAAAAAPTAKLVAIDVMDDSGKAMTSDVIAAADWILQNKDRYRIRVANFSLHASRPSSFRTDPLNRAVERLWHSGVVVVASVGNYASEDKPSGVPFAPANNPFVITVGATDLGAQSGGADDSSAPWSAYGRTLDGFLKPELGAPGRRLVGPVPPDSTMAREHPERVVAGRYMRMSGTSFAAPIVAGIAAQVLAVHPDWTPDDVKGALMVSARPVGAASKRSVGVGQVDARAAQRIARPPNPNRALTRFLIVDSAAGSVPVFDAASWDSTAKSDASWDSASWTDASWADASWADASWADASWADASWADASWADASWADASWADASWVD
jgi:serine protease AprX